MDKRWLLLPILLLAVPLYMISCGGGAGGGSASGGIGGTGITSFGRVTATGSITVNGVRYDTTDAQVFLDTDNPTDDSGLTLGMFVEVDGRINDDGVTGTADLVRVNDAVQGPISSIDAGANSLVVLGQTARVDELTVFDSSDVQNPAVNDINDLVAGDIVEVSGPLDANRDIRATRIEMKDPSSAVVEVTGFVSAPGQTTFMINDLVVDFSTADLEDFGGQAPAEDDFVEVKGTLPNVAGNTLTADRVENRSRNFTDDQEVEFEGFIISVPSAGAFTLDTPAGPVTVQTDAGTGFEGGIQADILVGTQVEVEGAFSGGVLIANKVSFRDSIKIEATAAENASLAIFNLPALVVSVDNLTEIDDKRDNAQEPASPQALVESIDAGDALSIRGRQTTGGSILATRLEVDKPPDPDKADEVEMQGPVDDGSIGTNTFDILGVTITVNASTTYQSLDGSSLSRTQFFASLQEGTLVKAKGRSSAGNAILAEELELED